MNKATADALCVNVTGEADSLALVYGAAGSAELPYVNHANLLIIISITAYINY